MKNLAENRSFVRTDEVIGENVINSMHEELGSIYHHGRFLQFFYHAFG
jgi:hypothetical protein